MNFSFDAYVSAALFDGSGNAGFALGDGTVRFAGGPGRDMAVEAHDGASLSAAVHPSRQGLVSGGDDGGLVWARPDGSFDVLAELKGKWIDTVAASAESGLIAFGAGRELHVRDVKDAAFQRTFGHERTIADVAFDPKGRRLAVASYGGAYLWYARIADQKPAVLKWAGSHIAVVWSPDGKFLISAMQENQLHGWRVADEKNMRMGGYPTKPRSLAFMSKGSLLATSGANGVVVWPFSGPAGPMGKEAAEVGYDESTTVTKVAAAFATSWLAAGTEDGRVWACDLTGQRIIPLKAEKGSQITALAITPDARRVAWGDEDGHAGVAEVVG